MVSPSSKPHLFEAIVYNYNSYLGSKVTWMQMSWKTGLTNQMGERPGDLNPTKNYRQLRNARVGKMAFLREEPASWLSSPENIHPGNSAQSEQVIFRNTHTYTCTHTHNNKKQTLRPWNRERRYSRWEYGDVCREGRSDAIPFQWESYSHAGRPAVSCRCRENTVTEHKPQKAGEYSQTLLP